MAVIPRVKFNIIDKTYIAPAVEGNTRVYIPFFSEKGQDGKIFKLYDPSQVVALFGTPNSFKYGNGLYYILNAVNHQDVVVWGIRLTPSDATYAGAVLTLNKPAAETTITKDATNSQTITVSDASKFSTGKTVAIYDPNDPISTVIYANIVSIDDKNNTITLSTNVTVKTNYYVTQIPDISLSPLSQTITDVEKFTPQNPTQPQIYFLARGKGKYYNNVKLIFERNISVEKYYMDEENFIPYYRGLFYNVTVVEQRLGSSAKILENTYTISFAQSTPDGNPVVNPVSGVNIFIDNVFKKNSYHVLVVSTPAAVDLVQEKPWIYGKALEKFFTSNPKLSLFNGSDGTLDAATMKSLLIQAYNGTYNSETAQMLISEYPVKPYEVEYVVDYTGDPDVQSAVANFAQARQDCIAIVSSPYSTNYQNDKDWRINVLNASNFSLGLYPGVYGEIYDPYNKRDIQLPQSFWALDDHLYVDIAMDLTVPAAGLNGGALRTPIKNPSYIPTLEEAEELAEIQINPLVKTADGTYFYLTQYTAYKRPTYLQRLNYVKFLNKVKKDLYPRLYDLLQRKATPEIIEEANRRVTEYLSNFTVDKPRMNIIESFEVNVNFDKSTFTLNIDITLVLVGIIEEINVNLILKETS